MPISNESQLWPKVLTCKTCSTPVEDGNYLTSKMTSYYYICPQCDDKRTKNDVKWVKQAGTY